MLSRVPTTFDYAVSTVSYDTVAAMTALTGDDRIGTKIVRGRTIKGDGGGGEFYWDAASVATANGGTIFESDAGGIGRFIQLYSGLINVKCFAATGDGGITDDTTALANAVAYANSLADIAIDPLAVNYYPILWFPPSLGYKSTATLAIRGGVEVQMDGPLLISAAAATPIIGIKYTDIRAIDFEAPRFTRSRFNVIRMTQSSWPGETDIGVQIEGHYVGNYHFQRIIGFHVGVDICAGYGDVKIGEIRDAKIGMLVRDRVTPENFTNQFHVVSGSFACSGGVGVGVARYGIVVRSVLGINTITFDGQSFELNAPVAGGADSLPYLLDATTGVILDVRIQNQRTEQNLSKFLRAVGQVRNVDAAVLYNDLEYSFSSELMYDDQTTGPACGNIKVYRHTGANSHLWFDFFNTGRLADSAVQLTGSVVTIKNMECATSVGAAPATQTFTYGNSGPAFDANGYMTCTGPLYGVRVKLNGARDLAIMGRKLSGDPGDISILCFDSSGVQIYSATAVRYEQSYASLNTGIYGGYYPIGLCPANTATQFFGVINFASNVATVFITVTSKTDGWILRRTDSRPEWFSATSHLRDQFVGAAIPIALANVTYKQGMRVAQIASAVGAPKGWVCTVPGVPTFVSEGNL